MGDGAPGMQDAISSGQGPHHDGAPDLASERVGCAQRWAAPACSQPAAPAVLNALDQSCVAPLSHFDPSTASNPPSPFHPQVIGVLCIATWVLGLMGLLFGALKAVRLLRISADEEHAGLVGAGR